MSTSRRAFVWLSVLAVSAGVSACDTGKISGPDPVKFAVSAVDPAIIAANTPTEIRITGSGFRTGATVVIDGQPATGVSVTNGSTIVATTPALPEVVSYVTVTNPGGQSAYQYSQFVVVGPPVITSVGPSTVRAGKSIYVRGTGLGAGAVLNIGGVASVVIPGSNLTEFAATIPILPSGPVDLTVTSRFGQTTTRAAALRYLGSTVAASSSSVETGESLTISYRSEGWEWSWDDRDWIGVFKPGAGNQTSAAVWWTYFEAADGSFTVPAPSQSGSYEIRLLQNSHVQATTPLIVR